VLVVPTCRLSVIVNVTWEERLARGCFRDGLNPSREVWC
jgi:hypothetical protein